MRSTPASGLVALAPFVLATAATALSPVAQEPEFQVDTYTPGTQYGSSVAVRDNGDFVVVWSSQTSPGTDTSGASVQGQRFASDGTTLGPQFQVNT